MTDKPENPPAFPWNQHQNEDGTWDQDGEQGMTLRDYFAAESLGGFLSHPECTASSPENDAKWAYKYADAMLKERSK